MSGVPKSVSVWTRVADGLHKTAVVGLLSFFGYQGYQIGSKVLEGKVDSPYMHSTYREDVNAKIKQEYRERDNVIDQRDWYQKEDNSYLKDVVRPNITTPQFKQEYEKQRQQQQ
jgi:hypothetical protein